MAGSSRGNTVSTAGSSRGDTAVIAGSSRGNTVESKDEKRPTGAEAALVSDMKRLTVSKTESEMFVETVDDMAELLIQIIDDIRLKGIDPIVDTDTVRMARTIIGLLAKAGTAGAVVGKYIEYSHPYWHKIHEGDRSFFTGEGAMGLFRALPGGHVKDFKKLAELKDKDGKYVLTKIDTDGLLEFFTSLTKLAIVHIHKGRTPRETNANGVVKRSYTTECSPEITDKQLADHARLWGVLLTWS